MALHLANPSRQNHIFPYREPVNNLLAYVDLRSGAQAVIGHGWTAEQTAKVVRQVEQHGGRDAAETHGKMGRFSGLLYRDIGEISEDEIRMGNDAEEQTRDERSATQATRAALGFDRSVRSKRKERPSARTTEVVVQQEVARGERAKGNEIAFGLTVDPEGRNDVKLPVD